MRVLHRLESSSLLCQQVSTVQAFQKLVFTTSHSYVRKPHEYLRKINHAGHRIIIRRTCYFLFTLQLYWPPDMGSMATYHGSRSPPSPPEGRNIQLLNDLASTPCILMAIAFVISKSNAPVHDSFTYG